MPWWNFNVRSRVPAIRGLIVDMGPEEVGAVYVAESPETPPVPVAVMVFSHPPILTKVSLTNIIGVAYVGQKAALIFRGDSYFTSGPSGVRTYSRV